MGRRKRRELNHEPNTGRFQRSCVPLECVTALCGGRDCGKERAVFLAGAEITAQHWSLTDTRYSPTLGKTRVAITQTGFHHLCFHIPWSAVTRMTRVGGGRARVVSCCGAGYIEQLPIPALSMNNYRKGYTNISVTVPVTQQTLPAASALLRPTSSWCVAACAELSSSSQSEPPSPLAPWACNAPPASLCPVPPSAAPLPSRAAPPPRSAHRARQKRMQPWGETLSLLPLLGTWPFASPLLLIHNYTTRLRKELRDIYNTVTGNSAQLVHADI